MERDGPEPDRDREREREVGEPEDDRLGGQLAQVAADPGRRGDGQRAGDDDRPRLADADRRPGPAAARDERDAGRRTGRRRSREDGGPRVGERRASGRTRRGSPSVTAGASRREPAASPTTASAEPDERAEDEEQPQVGRSSRCRCRRSSTTCAGSMASAASDRGDEADEPDAVDARRPRPTSATTAAPT